MRAVLALFLCISLFFGGHAKASTDLYPLPPAKEKQFQGLMHQFRCLVCQNQDLADSNADLAADLRGLIYERVLAGQSDEEIKTYLTDRYGDFVLYQPEFKPATWILWMMPVALLVLAAIGFYYFVNQRKISA